MNTFPTITATSSLPGFWHLLATDVPHPERAGGWAAMSEALINGYSLVDALQLQYTAGIRSGNLGLMRGAIDFMLGVLAAFEREAGERLKIPDSDKYGPGFKLVVAAMGMPPEMRRAWLSLTSPDNQFEALTALAAIVEAVNTKCKGLTFEILDQRTWKVSGTKRAKATLAKPSNLLGPSPASSAGSEAPKPNGPIGSKSGNAPTVSRGRVIKN